MQNFLYYIILYNRAEQNFLCLCGIKAKIQKKELSLKENLVHAPFLANSGVKMSIQG